MSVKSERSILHRGVLDAKLRLRRVRPDLIAIPYRILVFGCWASAAGLGVVILLDPPTIVSPILVQGTSVGFTAPLWFRLLVAASIGLLGVAAVVLVDLSRPRVSIERRAHFVLLSEIVLAMGAGFPALVLAADRARYFAIIAVILLALAETTIHVARARAPRRMGVVGAIAVALPWALLLAYQFFPQPANGSQVWLALFWFAAILAAFGAFYAITRASESRVRFVRFRHRRGYRSSVLVFVVVVAVAVMVSRFTVARSLFGDEDAAIWVPRATAPTSWIHAVIVASVLAAVVTRSFRRPLRREAERGVSAAIAAIGTITLWISGFVVTIGLAVLTVSGRNFTPTDWIDWSSFLQLVLILSLGIVAMLPRFRGTTGRWIALVSVVYLAPVLFLVTFVDVLPLWVNVATSVQVAVLLLLIAVVMLVVTLVRPELAIPTPVIMGLTVVPLVVLHAGLLLPAVWSGAAGPVVVIAGVSALLFFMPKVAADPRRRARDLLKASAALAVAFSIYVLAPALFQFRNDSFTTSGALWLSVTVIAALSFTSESPSAMKHSEITVR